MSVDVAGFKTRFPEFANTDTGLIQSCLDEAGRQCDAAVFSTRLDDAVRYKAAHLLAVSPMGQDARLVRKDGGSIYNDEFKNLQRQRSFFNPRVA